ncbi:MAG: serine hydroxymethyltransferase [Candidatus Pacebacteria bacterium]|nr:serine hydroxymethyltransferase [Candidatus Paceibacterota bacterium]PIR63973.1 MAG: serine hydroxymethyltransferase [Candidatus Pacebacteria bacterium CG10_big_fil_rev_8_21_14_0_10_40_26]PIZ79101.1 MAG: serine hydroxymethyltransferase [Candidatus Pacebacteria bacterium CG_4_10_14_0_2_um_filter_40_20]PJA69211.1 MAG: serine hydroxymethyltransferase [Candidatus Pacebacteria bacterium CG_4_9_14_3_um_filter_40_12]PJC42067.1 MAG: serine hydroxymethyltransferase [Candidatus Pacebacteria bacterium 
MQNKSPQRDEIVSLITQEEDRQIKMIGLIPSENAVSPEVSEVLSSCLSNKYAEGYPGKRYYEGNQIIDKVENLARDRVKELFSVPYVNVQPYSGSPANLAIYFALMQPGDTLLGLKLANGGHLTHGHPKVTGSGTFYNSVQYGVLADARIDFDEVRELAHKHKPKVIVAGNTAYPFELDFKKFRAIADEVDAWLVADISHVTGLVIGGEHMSPVPFAHVVMSTTHKTFRGPRGAMIMVTDEGMARDPKLGKKIDAAIIPGLQGGPHNATTAGIAIAAAQAMRPEFTQYAKRVTANATALAEGMLARGVQLVGGGTETHLMVIDLTRLGAGLGTQVAYALDVAGIYANKNTVPNEPGSPFYPSGIRIGTPLVTTRGMNTAEMKQIAEWIARVIEHTTTEQLPKDLKARRAFLKDFKKRAKTDKVLRSIREEVEAMATTFPLFKW